MYGENINQIESKINKNDDYLIIVGAEKVPREVYENADYNIAVGNQPHSEISALAVLLDRLQDGNQFKNKFKNPNREIVPSKNGKNVTVHKKRA